MSSMAGRFACDSCGKRFKWKPEIAGRKAKCACGETLVVPDEMPGDEGALPSLDQVDADTYDTKEEPVAPRPQPPRPAVKPATPPQRVRQSEKEKMPLNWSGAFWLFLSGGGILAYGIYLIVDPHDPREDDGRRVRGYKRLLNLLYSIGGHWTAVSILVVLGLAILACSYFVLRNKITDDE